MQTSKKIRVMLFTLVLLVVSAVPVLAGVSLPTISSSKYIATYTYASSGVVYAYKDSSLKNKTGGYIACSTDECRIYQISGNAVKVNYPTKSGRKTAWFSRDAFTYRNLAKDAAQIKFTANKKVTTYRWKENNKAYGYLENGDTCYLLRGDKDSNWLQLIYTVGSHYKMGWVKGADIKSVIWPEAPAKKVDNGTYNILSALDTSKAVDVDKSLTSNGTKILIWALNTDKTNQKFKLVNIGSNVYKICSSLDEQKVLDVTGGKRASGIKIQLYQWANVDAQKWEFFDAGQGYYYIRNKLGYYLDLTGANTQNGTQLQVYTGNKSGAQKWKLQKASTPGEILPTSVTLNRTSGTLKVGESLTLTATVSPSNATDKTVTWSSSKSEVASVSGGKVTAKSSGEAVITARTHNGKTASYIVTIIDTGTIGYPMKSYRMTQSFAHYSNWAKVNKGRPYHAGIDIVSKDSNINIYAAADGTVTYAGYTAGNGYHVIISHNLFGTSFNTLYSHMKKGSLKVKKGEKVRKGTQIGVMGNTGSSTGAHLHFGIFKGSSTDPVGYVGKKVSSLVLKHNSLVFYDPVYVIRYSRLPS